MNRKMTFLLICFIALLGPGILLAQEDISLQSLSDRIDSLFSSVTDLATRIEALETQVAPPPSTSTPTITATPPGSTATPAKTVTPTKAATPTPSSTTPRYEVHAIFDEYEANEARADAKYLNKIIEVTGIILDIEKKGGGVFSGPERYEVTLDGKGFLRFLDCDFPLSLKNSVLALDAGQSVTLRGFVSFGNTVKIRMQRCEIVE